MNKVLFSSLMLLSATTYADNTPTFDFTSGALNMPFVASSQGSYSALMNFNPGSTYTFNINLSQIRIAGGSSDTGNPSNFDFNSGVLTLPRINTSLGIYNAKLQFENPNTFRLLNIGSSNIGGCPLFPADNVWNTPVDKLPLHSRSAAWINTIRTRGLQGDFGADYGNGPFGQPYNVVAGSQVPQYTFNFEYPSESNISAYPIPDNFLRENTPDKRLFIINTENCNLYELYNAQKNNNQWTARRGAIWDLRSNALRPLGWGSADEGGFPTVPGLIRYDEVASGVINHALRFTFPAPNTGIWPARHVVGAGVPVNDTLPMGARLRLKQSYDISKFAPELQVILQAMKTYGIILTDDGSALFLSGTPDNRWNNDSLHNLLNVKGSDFEAVDSECMKVNEDSGQADRNKC